MHIAIACNDNWNKIFSLNHFFMECRNSDQIKQFSQSVSFRQKTSFSSSFRRFHVSTHTFSGSLSPEHQAPRPGWGRAGHQLVGGGQDQARAWLQQSCGVAQAEIKGRSSAQGKLQRRGVNMAQASTTPLPRPPAQLAQSPGWQTPAAGGSTLRTLTYVV